ncbi:MAG: glycine cleavage system protein GcvH [Erysipelotrichaceae bacterium]|jgi:glycine cleavage system H protein|nr:glycine cleavage system protein GcvH [Erysipelotrichaceae bacterium]
MNTPKELKYAKTHEWVRFTSDTECEVGLSDFAQDALGDLVFVNLPETDTEAVRGETICDVESVKAVSDVYAPVSGTVTAVNEDLLDSPELINNDPYGAWLFRLSNVTDTDELLDAEGYEKVCAEEEQ